MRAALAGPGGQSIMLLCIARGDGTVHWQREVDRGNEMRLKHNASSPSPVTDGEHVWVTSDNVVGPDGHDLVGPVVVASFEPLPGLLRSRPPDF